MKTEHQQPLRETLPVEYDPDTGDYFLTLPQHMLDSVGWKEGDTIKWEPSDNGAWILSKKSV